VRSRDLGGLRRWKALEAISATLTHSPAASALDVTEWDWEAIVALASEHFVSPALAAPIEQIAGAPQEAKVYFRAIRDANARRNNVIARSLSDIVGRFHEQGVDLVLTKGAANVADGVYQDPAERVVGDIDLLVATREASRASRLLDALGYVAANEAFRGEGRLWKRRPPAFNHHLPTLTHRETGVGVDLHRSLFAQEYAPLLPAELVIRRATRISFDGQDLLIPSATDRLIHNIGHDQLHHNHAATGDFELRQLRDLALLVSKRSGTIDWDDVEGRFAGIGRSDVLHRYAASCLAFFGVNVPVAQPPVEAAVERLRSSMLNPRQITHLGPARRALRLTGMYLRGFARDPALAVNLLNPWWWPRRLRAIKNFFYENPSGE
jgi:hypothetical protein